MSHGHHVTVITCAPNCPNGVLYEGYQNRLFQREYVDQIEVVRVATFIAANKGTFLRIANYISYLLSSLFFSFFLKRPDLIIATSPQFFCGWAGVLASKLRRVPFLLEVRDIWPDSIVAVGAMRNRWILRMLGWLEQKMYASARHIVTVGEGYKQSLEQKGVPPEKITVVTNGVNREVFYPREADPALKSEMGLEGKFVCSYIGTIGMACGLDVVLRAGELLQRRNGNNYAFLLVGDGAERVKLEEQAKQMGLKNVYFTGRQDHQRIPDFFAVSDVCLIHLKKKDLFKTVMPSKIFEAAGMARPVIIGVEGFASQLVDQAKAGICIEPENETQLLEAIERMAQDKQYREQCGNDGYNYITRHFDRDQLAADYLKVIQRTAAPA
ncbi:glycosyltransferase family 4 protein [Candidatus Sumerlaeota bacterium]|nr:glycosyltransferase family 4 protein [Candidatus Sumerlaeota bacterium]